MSPRLFIDRRQGCLVRRPTTPLGEPINCSLVGPAGKSVQMWRKVSDKMSFEALTSADAKAKLVAARGDDTIRTRVFDIVRNLDWPAMYTGRALQNAFSRQWHGRETELEKSLPTEAPRYAQAAEANDLDTSVVFAGECVDLIRDVKPAAAIVAALVHEAEAALRSNAR